MIWIAIATLLAVSITIAVHAWRHRAGPPMHTLNEDEVAEHGRPLATHVEILPRSSSRPKP